MKKYLGLFVTSCVLLQVHVTGIYISIQIPCTYTFLPSANQVWRKAMFLLACVILFTGVAGLCMMSLPVWLPGPMFLLGSLCLWSHVPSRWDSVSGPMFLPGQKPPPHRDLPPPTHGKERAVRILLKCILVVLFNCHKLCLLPCPHAPLHLLSQIPTACSPIVCAS